MTLELNQVTQQVKAMGQSLAQLKPIRDEALKRAGELLQEFSTAQADLEERIQRAERVQQSQRFGWVGAAPAHEAIGQAYPLPPCPEQVTIIASDGSQILPDPHAINLYYLINTSSIVYRHGSDQRPVTYNPKPVLCYEPEDIFDEYGFLVSTGEVNVKRDLAELEILIQLAPEYTQLEHEPVVALLDGQLTLRVIDLPFYRQQAYQDEYIGRLNLIRQANVLLAGYIDRPRSTFVLALLHLASLALAEISEASLQQSSFRHLTDLELFVNLGPGQRSAIFRVKAKGLEKYDASGHGIHFFYLNVSRNETEPQVARVEIPAWLAANEQAVNTLHAVIVRQARITGNYPYVLARAHELAIISNEEREAVELMLAVEMRRQGFNPALSPKQFNKNLLAGKESFKL